MLTQEEIDAIREGLVTKEDLKAFATRNDLKGLVHKTDLSRFEKKVNKRFNILEEKIETIDEKVDGVLKFASNIEEERDANEKRLAGIEASLNV